MSKALVVIDMQPDFYPSDKVISNCRKQIKDAIKKSIDIIFVEYKSFGPTLTDLKEPIKKAKYGRVSTRTKTRMDGSLQVKNIVSKLRHKVDSLVCCGIFTDQCVYSTVKGLNKRLPTARIEVVAKACASDFPSYHIKGLANMRKLPNVKIV